MTQLIDIAKGRDHMRYLNRIIAIGTSHRSKRCDWLKFCHVCGADISHLAKGVRYCADCIPERAYQRHEHHQLADREESGRRTWRRRIAALSASKDFSTSARPVNDVMVIAGEAKRTVSVSR